MHYRLSTLVSAGQNGLLLTIFYFIFWREIKRVSPGIDDPFCPAPRYAQSASRLHFVFYKSIPTIRSNDVYMQAEYRKRIFDVEKPRVLRGKLPSRAPLSFETINHFPARGRTRELFVPACFRITPAPIIHTDVYLGGIHFLTAPFI